MDFILAKIGNNRGFTKGLVIQFYLKKYSLIAMILKIIIIFEPGVFFADASEP